MFVQVDDQVAGAQAGALCRGAGLDAVYDRTLLTRSQAKCTCKIGREVLHRDTKCAAFHPAVLNDLIGVLDRDKANYDLDRKNNVEVLPRMIEVD